MSTDGQKLFCSLPWTLMEVHGDGGAHVCCPRWHNNTNIGNIFEGGKEIWNSANAQRFRAGILDGSFSMCDRVKCPLLAAGDLPKQEDVQDSYLRSVIEEKLVVAPRLPRHIKLAHDDSCNLSCPSCRSAVIIAKRSRIMELDNILQTSIIPFIEECTVLDIAGDGDPFASKHYRDILHQTAEIYPSLKINLHTNGVLCDEKSWDQLKLDGRVWTVQVSIDAAQEDTYNIVRRGGSFVRLLENLDMLSRKRREGQISHLQISFVVQKCNFKEMHAFVELGKRLNVDEVSFSLIYHWDRAMTFTEFTQYKVWDVAHPDFVRFLELLNDPIFDLPTVRLGDVHPLRELAIGNASKGAA